MIDIIVQRGAGDNPGDDIVDPFLSTIPAAVARGTYEINASTSVDIVQLQTTYRSGVHDGDLCEVHDALQGVTWRGKIVNILHNVAGTEIWSQLTVERVA